MCVCVAAVTAAVCGGACDGAASIGPEFAAAAVRQLGMRDTSRGSPRLQRRRHILNNDLIIADASWLHAQPTHRCARRAMLWHSPRRDGSSR